MNGKITLLDKISGSKITIETKKEHVYRQFLYDFKRCRDMRIPFELMGIYLKRPQEFELGDIEYRPDELTELEMQNLHYKSAKRFVELKANIEMLDAISQEEREWFKDQPFKYDIFQTKLKIGFANELQKLSIALKPQS